MTTIPEQGTLTIRGSTNFFIRSACVASLLFPFVCPLLTVTSPKVNAGHRGNQSHSGSYVPAVPSLPRPEYHAPVAPVRVHPPYPMYTFSLSDGISERRCPTTRPPVKGLSCTSWRGPLKDIPTLYIPACQLRKISNILRVSISLVRIPTLTRFA